MIKNNNKNFIAFTLSEMMIVLLIVSVISAATLPAITNKKTENAVLVNSSWQSERTFDYGNYYISPNAEDVIIGLDTSEYTAAQVTNFKNRYGNATLRLTRPMITNLVYKNLFNRRQVPYGSSDIVFYDYSNKVAGKIAADLNYNIALGKDALRQYATYHPMNKNFVLGHYAAFGHVVPFSPPSWPSEYNTFIGNNAASYSTYISNNVVVGNDTQRMNLGDNNIIIGNYAASNSPLYHTLCGYFSDSISVGYYSSYMMCGVYDTVNIGAYSGAYSSAGTTMTEATPRSAFYHINIGDSAGNDSGASSHNKEVINIGYGAGFVSYEDSAIKKYYDSVALGSYAGAFGNASVNIGRFAGYAQIGTKLYSSINIGLYSGMNQNRACNAINIGKLAGANADSTGSSEGDLSLGYYSNINIGEHAGYADTSYDSINIGSYAGAIASSSKSATTSFRNINIGAYAGYYVNGSLHNYNNIYIGPYGNWSYASTAHNQVVIGCEGFNSTAPNRMCIGGKYPSSSTELTELMKPGGFNAASVFITPGVLGSSGVGWNNTAIWLMAKHILSPSNSMATFSDRTLKENIRKTSDGIDKVRKIKVRQFNFKKDKDPRVGVIAQELMDIYPNLVEKSQPLNGKTYYTVRYDRFVYSLAQAVKDVDKLTLDLQKNVSDNLALLTKLSNRIMTIESKLDALSASDKALQIKLKEIDSIIDKVERK